MTRDTVDTLWGIGFCLLLAIPVLPIYLTPTIIAYRRRFENSHSWVTVFLINFFLGWSGMGYVLALAFAWDNRPRYN